MALPSARFTSCTAWALVLLVYSCSTGRIAWADDLSTVETAEPTEKQATDRAHAATLGAKAKKHFVVGEFREAALIYKEAFQVSSDPKFLLSMGQCYEHLDQPEDWKKAIFIFKGFLSYETNQSDRTQVNQAIAKLQERLNQVKKPTADQTNKAKDHAVENQQPPTLPYKGKLKHQEPKRWFSIIELSAGISVLSRSFDFGDPRIPADPSNYRSGFVSALLLEGALYPITIWTKRHLGSIGLEMSYWHVFGLKSQLPGVTSALSTSLLQETSLQELRWGVRYRWNLLNRETSPVLIMGLGHGYLRFEIDRDSNQNLAPLPNIAYHFLDIAVAKLQLPFFTRRSFVLGGLASFNYLHVLSSGDIEATDSSGYGSSTTGGLDFGGGLYAKFYFISVKLALSYQHFFFDFDGNCYKEGTGCKVAGGALDRYLSFSSSVGFSF